MVTEKDEEALDAMLSSVGISMKMEEHYMDIITGLTGCGPTYVRTSPIGECQSCVWASCD